jgi:hypothetical protein
MVGHVNPSSRSGMTWTEMLVGLFVVICLAGILFALSMPAIGWGLRRGPMTQILSNMKQLQIATQAMTLDNMLTGGNSTNWTCTGTTPLTFGQWSNALVPAYLGESDFKKLQSYHEVRDFWPDLHIDNVVNAYAVVEDDDSTTLLFATKNWLGPGSTNLDNTRYSEKGFVVFRKGGDGAILTKKQVSATNLIGTGGHYNYLPLR